MILRLFLELLSFVPPRKEPSVFTLCPSGLCEAYNDINALAKKLVFMERISLLGAGGLLTYGLQAMQPRGGGNVTRYLYSVA